MKNIIIPLALSIFVFSCTKNSDSSAPEAAVEQPVASAQPAAESVKSKRVPQQRVLILQYETAHQLENDVNAVFSLFDKNVFMTSKFETYYDEVYKLVSKVNSGEIVSGDKVFLLLNVHGGKKGYESQSGHIFAAEDGNFNVERLSSMIQYLLSREIQVALNDQSCFSGETLQFYKKSSAFKNLCVMAGDSNEQIAFAGGLDSFLNFIKITKSFNMETAYVLGRDANYNASPGINSDIFEKFHLRSLSLQSQLGINNSEANIWMYIHKYSSLDGKKFQIDLLKKDILDSLKTAFIDGQVNYDEEFKMLNYSLDAFHLAINKMYFDDSEIFNFLSKDVQLDNGFKTTYLENLIYTASGQHGIDVDAWSNYNIDTLNQKNPSISKEQYDLIEKRFRSFQKINLSADAGFEKIKDRFRTLASGDLIFKIGMSVVESEMHRKFYTEQLKNGNSPSNPCREFILNQLN
jgi:hypothetical protein